jgi:hypothetical protein
LFWHSFMYRDLHVTPEAVVDLRCELKVRSWRGVLDTTLCDKVCQWLGTGRWVWPGTPISSINKTDRHDIAEIYLKVALNIITPHFTSNTQWNACTIRHKTQYEEKHNYKKKKRNTHNTPQKRLITDTTHVLECVCYPFQLSVYWKPKMAATAWQS